MHRRPPTRAAPTRGSAAAAGSHTDTRAYAGRLDLVHDLGAQGTQTLGVVGGGVRRGRRRVADETQLCPEAARQVQQMRTPVRQGLTAPVHAAHHLELTLNDLSQLAPVRVLLI